MYELIAILYYNFKYEKSAQYIWTFCKINYNIYPAAVSAIHHQSNAKIPKVCQCIYF